MHLLYEEGGELRIATILSSSGSGETQSWQASALSGKHLKLKAKEVWLQFDHANPQEILEEAHGIAATIDLQLLWDCAPDQEFSFQAIAKEYFGDAVRTPQLIGLAIALQGAPVYFRRKGRGVFMRAPLEQLQAGLAAIERKQTELLQQEAWQAELVEGRLPDALHSQVNSLLFRPDKNSLAYKAFHGACEQTGEHPARLLMRCGALDSPQSYHYGQFVQAHFPKGTGFASDFQFTPEEFEKAIAGLPTAQVKAFSIDDASTTEIDDALSLTPIGDGLYRLGIHIAAPGLLIQKGDRFDQIARQRMSTVYFPGDKITMLPEQFVEYFSLDAGSARPAISLYLEIDASGQRTQTPPHSALELVPIETNLRLDDWEPLVDEAFLAQENSSLPHHVALARLWVLAQNEHQKRQEQRLKDGLRAEVLGQGDPNALIRDFNFKITSSTNEIVIEPRVRGSILDTIVAECMILCNRIWGQALAEHGLPALFRTQKGWGPMRTRMQTSPGPHEGLGVECYAWCTSPLRRYADLVNQWQLIAMIRNGVTAKMTAPFPPKDSEIMGIAADFDTVYLQYGEYQSRMERYWCLRWLAQAGLPHSIHVRHLKEGMSRLEPIPLHLPIPELASHPRLTRAKIEIMEIDLLDLSAKARVLELETGSSEVSAEVEGDLPE
ncbi:MAG: hypothetical protein RLY18_432 [Pseudomonadota bacterium]